MQQRILNAGRIGKHDVFFSDRPQQPVEHLFLVRVILPQLLKQFCHEIIKRPDPRRGQD